MIISFLYSEEEEDGKRPKMKEKEMLDDSIIDMIEMKDLYYVIIAFLIAMIFDILFSLLFR